MRGFGRILAFFGLFLMVAGFVPTFSKADFYTHRWESEHQSPYRIFIGPELSYYNSGSNYRTDGVSVIPGTLDQYSRFQSDITLAYGFNEVFTGYGRLSWASVDITDTKAKNLPSTSGPLDQSLGVNARIADGRRGNRLGVVIDLQLQLDIPGYDNTAASAAGVTLLGDGTTDITLGALIGVPFGQDGAAHWQLDGGFGYTKRSNNFGAGVPWSFKIGHLAESSGWIASMGLFGYQTFATEAVPNGKILSSSTGADGSYIVNSPQPRHTSIRLAAGAQLNPSISITLAWSRTFMGEAAPEGSQITLGMQFKFGEIIGHTTSDPSDQTPSEYGHANQGFINYGLEAQVLRTNDRFNLVKINKGTGDGVADGQYFDLFAPKREGGSEQAVARAKVKAAKSGEAVLQVVEYYREVYVDEGFVARQVL